MFGVCPIDIVVHRHEDGSISELFRLDPVLRHFSLDLEAAAVFCVLGKVSTRTRRFLRVFLPIHNIQEVSCTTQCFGSKLLWIEDDVHPFSKT